MLGVTCNKGHAPGAHDLGRSDHEPERRHQTRRATPTEPPPPTPRFEHAADGETLGITVRLGRVVSCDGLLRPVAIPRRTSSTPCSAPPDPHEQIVTEDVYGDGWAGALPGRMNSWTVHDSEGMVVASSTLAGQHYSNTTELCLTQGSYTFSSTAYTSFSSEDTWSLCGGQGAAGGSLDFQVWEGCSGVVLRRSRCGGLLGGQGCRAGQGGKRDPPVPARHSAPCIKAEA